MNITNLSGFFIFLAASALIYWFLITAKWRRLFLFVCSFLFICFFSVTYSIYFLFNIALVYTAGILMSRRQEKKRPLLKVTLVWLIGNLCFFKYSVLLLDNLLKARASPLAVTPVVLPNILFPIGLSYITFRLIHYIIEVYRGNAPGGSFVDFALYVMFFPTFLAGPVERFQKFYPQSQSINALDLSNVNYGLFRMILGLVKKLIIADNLKNIITPVLVCPQLYSRVVVIAGIYGLAIQVYMDFAGYTDIAIGASRVFGYKIMENFNRPFLQKNIALFWRSWHISVYSLIRDYFFLPVFGCRPSRLKTYIGIFCTMMVFTLWHKGSLGFLILGVYHGLGLVIWNIFQQAKNRFSLIRSWTSKRFLDPVSIFLTFSFVSFGLIFFMDDIHQAMGIIRRLTNT